MSKKQENQLHSIFRVNDIKIPLKATDKDGVFEELVNLLTDSYNLQHKEEILFALRERENKMSTGIKQGIAIPHCKLDFITTIMGVMGISRQGIDYDALDNNPVHVVFLFISNKGDSQAHLEVLSKIAKLTEQVSFYNEIVHTSTPSEVHQIIQKYEALFEK
jgi:PTS system fructose-specific IIC component/PTS system nitrogen regulatory IIA component